jgi:hypothetical protein
MYKTRFTQWEFHKHNRQSDMAIVLRKKRQRDAQGKKSTFVVRTKEISPQEVDRYVERKQVMDPAFEEAPADVATPMHIRCFTPPCSPYPQSLKESSSILHENEVVLAHNDAMPTRKGKRERIRSNSLVLHNGRVTQRDWRCIQARPRSSSVCHFIAAPDVFRRPEMLFNNISSYVQGSISSGTWYYDHRGSIQHRIRTTIDPFDFYNLCGQATDHFKKLSTLQGRRLLSRAFSLLPTMIREEDPWLPVSLMDILLKMSQTGFGGICALIQNYTADLVTTILPREHLCRHICISVSYTDPDQNEVVMRSWRCLTDSLIRTGGRFSYSSVMSEIDFICQVHKSSDPQRAEQLLRKVLANYEQVSMKLDNAALYITGTLVQSLYAQGKYAEMEALLEDTLLQARKEETLSMEREAACLAYLAWSRHKQYKNGPAEESMRSAITLYAKWRGERHPTVIRCCRRLEEWLREWNRNAEADQLLCKIDEMIGSDGIELNAEIMQPS